MDRRFLVHENLGFCVPEPWSSTRTSTYELQLNQIIGLLRSENRSIIWISKDVLIEVILLPMNVAYFRRVLLTSF